MACSLLSHNFVAKVTPGVCSTAEMFRTRQFVAESKLASSVQAQPIGLMMGASIVPRIGAFEDDAEACTDLKLTRQHTLL